MQVQLIKHADIDKVRYNSAVHFAPNGNIFGYKWYLDAMAREWDVLVEGEYETVMPLPYRSLFAGRQGLYQPELVRELAIYSVNVLSPKRLAAFWNNIPEEYKAIDLQLEPRSRPGDEHDFDRQDGQNYYLRLDSPYEKLAANFATETAARIAKAEDMDLLPSSNVKPERIAELYQKLHGKSVQANRRFHGMQRIMWNALHRGWGFASGIVNREQQLLAVTFLLYSHGRAVNLIALETEEGRQKEARTLLYDNIIRSHADRQLVLDFNGAEDLALAFGAEVKPFIKVKRDKRILGLF